tara:strand:+ start:80 stop:1618 length:1539 start_codon:yes stop_codon:yes gene_type:complete
MVDWATAQRGIFAGESGGDYSALFNYQNRPGGLFENTDVTKMTIGQLKDFTNPGGKYARYVKKTNPEGVLSTPLGAYQVVGRTLKDAVKALNISDDQIFDQATQDKIGRWIFDTQGTGAWQGYKAQTAPLAAPGMFNQSPQRRNAPMQRNAGNGLLASLGLQKMQPGAAGETGQRFFERDSFKDFSGVMANWLNSQTINPDPNMSKAIADIRNQRTEKKRRNKTVEYLRKAGMDDIASMVDAGDIDGRDAMSAILKQRFGSTDDTTRSTQKFLNGTVYTVTDNGVKVYNPSGKLVTGQEAEEILKEANKFELDNRAVGEGLSESAKLQQKYVDQAFEKSGKLSASIANIDDAIQQIDAGAKRDIIRNALPDITTQSGQLTSALRRMGLDVISSVTFGALSEAELNIAMSTAYPPLNNEIELRKFLVARKSALTKLREYTEEAAMFLQNPNNTRTDWMQIVRERRDTSAASAGGNPYMDMTVQQLNEVYANYNSLNSAQQTQLVAALEAKRGQ